MKLQPRQQLLEIWSAAVRASLRDKNKDWHWGGRHGSNSISDAEQLLCFMYPASELPEFRLDTPDATSDDVLDSLTQLGDSVEIPKRLLALIDQYLVSYTDTDGRPIFAGGSYFLSLESGEEITPQQRALDVVDSYSMSITLMLGTLGFLKVFRSSVRREELHQKISDLEVRASNRLSAAMVGLLRSFTVNVFEPGSSQGKALLRTANQTKVHERRIQEELQKSLSEVRAGLRDLTIGSGAQVELDNPNLLFECGWAWGIVQNAPEVVTDLQVGIQPKGVAPENPFLYFTVNALVGLVDLWSERTRVLGLLNDDQQQLANALQRRWDITQNYWRTIATFGKGRWPLEDIPWRTTDGKESDYYSLGVTAMVVQYLVRSRAGDVDLGRVAGVLEELAKSARITRRPVATDRSAVALHHPGVKVTLVGSEELGPQLVWQVSDFAITLLKRTIWVASIAQSTRTRERLHSLADQIWDHIEERRFFRLPLKGLWDDASNVYAEVSESQSEVSWYFTERVVEFLVTIALTSRESPLRSQQLVDLTGELLAEAEHLLNREQVIRPRQPGQRAQSSITTVAAGLTRARAIMSERPASALALINEALLELDRLAAARENASEAM
ncbi:SCO2524 family protein [Acrocarpospora catenulata]|uniref:SCO2524 family protein n=1 Tax=Acrocarpospora catenulata TaxID=2836182 RepID=UPI001BD98D18|nr:SCO2524 family protein [Acrocarpospora catenulata]